MEIINLIYSKSNFKLLKSEINSGIDIPQDFVNKSSFNTLGSKFNIGDGIFVLSGNELKELYLNDNEYSLMRGI